MSVDMSDIAVWRRFQGTQPPSLDAGARLAHKLDMSPTAVSARLAQVGQMQELCLWLGSGVIVDERAR